MPKLPRKLHDHCTCIVDVFDDAVDAGQAFRVQATAKCPEGCDLTGLRIAFRAPDGSEVTAELGVAEEGDEYITDEIALAAPASAGRHRFVATILAPPKGLVHAAPPAEFEVTTNPHATRMNAWDVPTAIVAGEDFTFKVGVKCSSGCSLAGHEVQLLDSDQQPVAAAVLGDEPWAGTAALYWATVTARAPAEVRRHEWTVAAPPDQEMESPHAPGAVPLSLNVVAAPDFEVVVETVALEGQTPIRGARVIMHPYRAVTDDNGIARLRVAKGDYSILVSARKHLPVRTDVTLTDNLVTRAELQPEPPPVNPDELY